MKGYEAFKDAVALSESSNDYGAKNAWGYLGRYQFGMMRLTDLGLCEKIGKTYRWRAPYSEAVFLADHALQDRIFRRHVALLRQEVLKDFGKRLGKTILGVQITLSGSVAVCHLLGKGGLRDFLNGVDRGDALGTRASTYMRKFAGYDITADLVAA